jgi:8-oxo-dGTP pyrophosphatase MutT (NUDIX family)
MSPITPLPSPNIEQLEKIRLEGIRPGVVICLTSKKEILLAFRKDYKLWYLPQGGIEPGETPEQAFTREATDEIGPLISPALGGTPQLIHVAELKFNTGKVTDETVTLSDGSVKQALGKMYFVYHLETTKIEIPDVGERNEDYYWLPYSSTNFLVSKLVQLNKKKLTLEILDKVKSLGFLG